MAVDAHRDDADRTDAFPRIAFRRGALGQEAYLRGHRIAVWQIASAARSFDGDVRQVAHHFRLEPELVEEALSYIAMHSQEIEAELHYVETFDIERLRTFVPNAEVFEFHDADCRR